MENMLPYSSDKEGLKDMKRYSDLIKMNLHNHSTFSDGLFSPEAIVRKAISCGLNYVGITDHYLTRKVRSLGNSDLEAYINAINDIKDRYSDKIKVLVGLEIDASKERTDFDSIRYDLLNTMDFVLFEYVNDDLWGGMHLWELFNIVRKIEVPSGLAHNDISRNFRDIDYEALINVMEDNNIFVELSPSPRNSKFNRPYYRFAPDFFFALSRSRVPVSIGTDTHTNIEEVCMIEDAASFIEEMRLENNLITGMIL